MFSLAHWLPVAAALVCLAHMGGSATASISTYGLQLATKPSSRGRVMSADFMTQTLVIGCSQLAVVGLAAIIGDSVAAATIGACAVAYAAVWWAGSSGLDRLDERASRSTTSCGGGEPAATETP